MGLFIDNEMSVCGDIQTLSHMSFISAADETRP